jgi:hypothetical protein
MVEPFGVLRFALTSRYIRPETIPEGAYRYYVASAGAIPSDFVYEYDGGVKPAIEAPSRTGKAQAHRDLIRWKAMEDAGQMSEDEVGELIAEFYPNLISKMA